LLAVGFKQGNAAGRTKIDKGGDFLAREEKWPHNNLDSES